MAADAIELVCREIVELVTEYLGGTLPAADRIRFDQHLATCPPCTAYMAQVRTTLALAADLGAPAAEPGASAAPPDGEVARQLGDMFRRWHGKQKP